MFAQAFDRCNKYRGTSISQTPQTSIRPPQRAIDSIKKIAYLEALELHLTVKIFNLGAKTAEQFKSLADCRPYSTFLHISSLKTATLLMNASLREREAAQMTTIYRCRHNF